MSDKREIVLENSDGDGERSRAEYVGSDTDSREISLGDGSELADGSELEFNDEHAGFGDDEEEKASEQDENEDDDDVEVVASNQVNTPFGGHIFTAVPTNAGEKRVAVHGDGIAGHKKQKADSFAVEDDVDYVVKDGAVVVNLVIMSSDGC